MTSAHEAAAADFANQRAHVAEHLNELISLGGVSYVVSWWDERPETRLRTSVFGMLGIQLMAAVAGLELPSTCSGCGRTYWPQRKPYANRRRTFCEECRATRVPARLRQRDHRARQREEKVSE